MEEIREIKKGIRSLEIQGARNVAIQGLRAMKILALTAEADSTADLVKQMSKLAPELSRIRVTEPALRNGLATVLEAIRDRDDIDLENLRKLAGKEVDHFHDKLNSNIANICKYGSEAIPDGSTIFTHCHSSSVTSLIISQSKIKDLRVICTETRPRWQGRKTAYELAENQIDTTLFVDSATHMYLPEADLVLIGADSVGGGRLYNKIGSYALIHFAKRMDIPTYSVCETQKFDPLVGIGYVQPVEQRPASEVIDGEVPFKVRNPAFETVPVDMMEGIITEDGIVKPQEVSAVLEKYEHLVPELKRLVDWDDWEE